MTAKSWPLVAATALLGACGGPQSTLDPAGESARLIAGLWWGMFAWFTLVLLAVVALWIYAMRRRAEPVPPERARSLHWRWVIGGGIALPVVSLAAVLAAGIPVSQRLLQIAPDDMQPLRIEVIGHRWWWEVRYPDAGVVTANQVYVPTHVPLQFHISSADVIHSFWIPRLGGKLDAIPGRVNRLQLLATEAGAMRGQCAEFCGTGHAHMVFGVQALPEDQFQQWLSERQQPLAAEPSHESAIDAFRAHCGDCHRVAGISAGGAGPDLSDIGARRPADAPVVSGEMLPILRWLRGPEDSRRAGVRTVDHRAIAPDELEPIASWLETLGR